MSESTSVFSGSLRCLIYPNHFLVHNTLRTDVFFLNLSAQLYAQKSACDSL